MQRLGKNKGGYFGETIDIAVVLRQCLAAGRGRGWHVKALDAGPDVTLYALHRPSRTRHPASRTRRVYLSSGIHGDEPAGPLAVRQLIEDDDWPAEMSLWLCPCLNPTGFRLNRRENVRGLDLNRQYHAPRAADEVRAHVEWLMRAPDFDVCFCLHEDWEANGFYLYELNPDHRPSLSEAIVKAVSKVCPVDMAEEIEGRPAKGGIIRPSTDPLSRPQWPEAFFLLRHKTRLSYTLEAPSDFPLATRVAALAAAVKAGLAEFAAHTC